MKYVPHKDDLEEVVTYVIRAGRVRRWHTQDDVNVHQTIGEHTFGVLALLLQYHPNPTVPMIKAALYHDVPERFTGDTPATTKWYSDKIRRELDGLEQEVLHKMGLLQGLSVAQWKWIKACDFLELLMFVFPRRNTYPWEDTYNDVIVAFNKLVFDGQIPVELYPILTQHGVDVPWRS